MTNRVELTEPYRFFRMMGCNPKWARAYAHAEERAEDNEFRFEWYDDDEEAEACTGKRVWNSRAGRWEDEYKRYPAVCLAVLDRDAPEIDYRRPGRNALAGLGGIIESKDRRDRNNYRRYLQAELAHEAFTSHYSAKWY